MNTIKESGIIEQAREMATDYTNQAIAILDSLDNISIKQKDMLLSILDFTLERTY